MPATPRTTSPALRRPLALLVATSLLLVPLGQATARATAGDGSAKPCDTTHRRAKRSITAKVDGHRVVLGHLYVYDEGSRFCAFVTSAHTRWAGVAEYMKVEMGTSQADRFKDGSYTRSTPPIRLRDPGHGYVAMGIIRLNSGEHGGVVAHSETS